MESKKLCRSVIDKKICGVCGGVAKYFNIDANLVRLIWFILCFTTIGLIAYVAAAVILPVE